MHIPDGYLGPATAGTMYALSAPFWYVASRKVNLMLSSRSMPMIALLSAFCFVIQMINIPLPLGTTGHAVGAGLAAIILTPWPAVLAVTIALTIQAVFFGDGGITTLGANCFNMAVVQVFVAYYLYRMIPVRSARAKTIAAAVAGYFSLLVAGLLTGIELGVQPLLASDATGRPLYAPYPLSMAVPAMLIGHLIAGFAEAAVCAAALGFLLRSAPELVPTDQNSRPLPAPYARLRVLWGALAILIILTPLGLLAPGTAWGEWSSEQLRDMGLGFVPSGLAQIEGFWNAMFADYSMPGTSHNLGYFLSALCGVLLIVLVFAVITFAGRRRDAAEVKIPNRR